MTRVLLDTNVIVSALLFPDSTPDRVLHLALDEHDIGSHGTTTRAIPTSRRAAARRSALVHR